MTTMLNLDVLELTELNETDQQETSGGLGPIGLAILAYAAKQVIDNWQEIEKGFQDNYDPR